MVHSSGPHPFWHQGSVWGWLNRITFIARFISIIIISAPPQILRHQMSEVGDRWSTRLATFFSIKGQVVDTLGFAAKDHGPCRRSMEAALDGA